MNTKNAKPFRGLTKTASEWVFGSLLQINGKTMIIHPGGGNGYEIKVSEVYPETVGRATGWEYRTKEREPGIPIYGGDIVGHKELPDTWLVAYSNTHAGYILISQMGTIHPLWEEDQDLLEYRGKLANLVRTNLPELFGRNLALGELWVTLCAKNKKKEG